MFNRCGMMVFDCFALSLGLFTNERLLVAFNGDTVIFCEHMLSIIITFW